jgi:hypothetical protein
MFSIPFDEEIAKPFLKKAIEELGKVKFNSKDTIIKSPSTEILIDNLKNHIDKRFIELISSSTLLNTPPKTNKKIFIDKKDNIPLFTITLSFSLKKVKRKNVYLDIWESDTFQTVTDNIYFQLAGQVPAFTYLEKWVLIEEKTQLHLIIREIASRVSAKSLFKPNYTYMVKELEEPYDSASSRERVQKSSKIIS